ncbi:HAD family acid phosphatase [Sphingomonas sp. 1P06PA]|uniref:HAD family acid phosphatase n=1 Tax=Sphingomonas sp. 1P06PA TaxID=554121 RepID=UPI0039A509A8
MRTIAGVLATLSATACATTAPPARQAALPAAPPPGMQYLYGSAEAAALGQQAYAVLVADVTAKLAARRRHDVGVQLSVVPERGSRIDALRFAECGDKPAAAVFDIDETALLNLGYEYDEAANGRSYDAGRWAQWEKGGVDAVVPVPGAVTAFRALRAAGVTVIANSNRNAAAATETADALSRAGLGVFRHGETLFLKGDVGGGSGKDARRAAIADRWCVLALAGDQVGDFTDLLVAMTPGQRRAAAMAAPFDTLWGRGWFMLPNPVYGTGLGAGWDESFPPDRRWTAPVGTIETKGN